MIADNLNKSCYRCVLPDKPPATNSLFLFILEDDHGFIFIITNAFINNYC